MLRKNILILIILTLLFSLSATNVMAEGKNSPFLIVGKIPHLTKLLMQQWDNPELNLSGAQKSKLLIVRKATLSGVQRLGPEITLLEKQVADGIFAGKTPEELSPIVEDISQLKAEATMVQLRCIYDTSQILDQQQLDLLRKL